MKQLLLLILALLFMPLNALAKAEVNLYTWSGYFPFSVLQDFEDETGIHVNINTFDNNESLYAKMKTLGSHGYDVITPSNYLIERMRNEKMLAPLDKTKIQNSRHLNTSLLGLPFDPHNTYSLPFLWGITGIAYNKKAIKPSSIKSWASLWNKQYFNSLFMLDDMRDVFGVALHALGYSINDQDPEHIKQAYLKLKTLMPNILRFNTSNTEGIFVDEDIVLGMNWNGDTYQAWLENKNIGFIYPSDGPILWIDTMAIPAHAPHKAAAMKFINFICSPTVAKQIAIATSAASPNKAGVALLPTAVRNNPILYPKAAVVARSEMTRDLPFDVLQHYQHYWQQLKLG